MEFWQDSWESVFWQGFSRSVDMEMQDKAEIKAYISLIENTLLPAEVIKLKQRACGI